MNETERTPLKWIGSSRKDIGKFPDEVKKAVGFALHIAQTGEKPANAKPLKDFGGASVLEIVDNFDTDTYRAVYTVKFDERVYVLHCFQKKSKSGIKTPQKDIDLIKSRLKKAEEEHRKWLDEQKKKS